MVDRSVIVRFVGSEKVLVVSRQAPERASWNRIEAPSADAALAAIDAIDTAVDVSTVCAVLANADTDLASEETIALVSLLVMRGVMAFETSDPQIVRRILDTHAAISAGQIEVLES